MSRGKVRFPAHLTHLTFSNLQTSAKSTDPCTFNLSITFKQPRNLQILAHLTSSNLQTSANSQYLWQRNLGYAPGRQSLSYI